MSLARRRAQTQTHVQGRRRRRLRHRSSRQRHARHRRQPGRCAALRLTAPWRSLVLECLGPLSPTLTVRRRHRPRSRRVGRRLSGRGHIVATRTLHSKPTRRSVAIARQRRANRALQERERGLRIAQLDFGLGRMDVDIDRLRGHGQSGRDQRERPRRQPVAVGLLHRIREPAVMHGPAVDEQPDRIPRSARVVRRAGKALQRHRCPFRIRLQRQRSRGRLRAEDAGQRPAQRLRPVRAGLRFVSQRRATVDHQAQRAARVGQDCVRRRPQQRAALGPPAGQEGAARRLPGEQVDHFDRRADRSRRRARTNLPSLLKLDQRRCGLRLNPRCQRQPPGRRRNRRQRFAAKAVTLEPRQVIHLRQLRGGMPAKGQRDLLCGDAPAVVVDRDQLASRPRQLDGDPSRAGIDRILQQFLEHRRRTLDHLTRCNLRRHSLRQFTDWLQRRPLDRLDGRHPPASTTPPDPRAAPCAAPSATWSRLAFRPRSSERA